MRMARDATADRDAIARVRERFARGGWLQWPGSTFDHMECLGRDRVPMMFVSHPYHISDEGRTDMDLLRSAGLVVVEGGKAESWYGFGTFHIRIEHPAFSGRVIRPAPSPARFPAETAFEACLRRAGPRLLALARERAAELADAIRLVPCTGPLGVGRGQAGLGAAARVEAVRRMGGHGMASDDRGSCDDREEENSKRRQSTVTLYHQVLMFCLFLANSIP